ncbi:hypothetical protein BKA59DRAFT_475183 [Fusarium tricinctum]|uniref:Uncharacterized protein n=1 Tax=Fusarium tricinctum TaxID=61284 RepID=A0A8K0S446_9HYPO|nr:hypothetical protein BKA59DRAFT_475183 [Fusarium tricinctum]
MKLSVVTLLAAVPAIVAAPTPELNSEPLNTPARREANAPAGEVSLHDRDSRRWSHHDGKTERRGELVSDEEGEDTTTSTSYGGRGGSSSGQGHSGRGRGGRGRGGRGRGGQGRGGRGRGGSGGGHDYPVVQPKAEKPGG